ncbi:aminoglycoside phosphotransferase [Cordyceps fumosorosea ARSEF 2679]|uniref:Aminoglycoside phosphotransferase n=1 Tax=Cordyceps fumosorosea (strain ARSEF 2679) TaxID=1081104 RepID=A0A167SWX1_CORFA|nr:aminoglycoside phosphotransferase [Cordyceps fumosorosea ARSEF 2679]OAA60013.1 aminoglycoside phosphotransferase [Cordyceps fumosorosea ARSEF 2679]
MQLDNPKDIIWAASNYERHFQLGKDWFVKRQLSTSELPVDVDGQVIRPLWDTERLRNEHAATTFIRQHTTIPVPEGQLYSRDGLLHFASRRVRDATQLDACPPPTRTTAVAAVEQQMRRFIIPQLQRLQRAQVGSAGRHLPLVPPRRVYRRDDRAWERPASADGGGEVFVFCHNDLEPKNVWIHPETFKIVAVTGWEQAGFFPHCFELALWTALGWEERQAMQRSVLARDLAFFGLRPGDLRNCVRNPCLR